MSTGASALRHVSGLGFLEIVARRSHRQPSSYIPLGRAATVVDGAVDLKLGNRSTIPQTTLAEGATRVERRGAMEPSSALAQAARSEHFAFETGGFKRALLEGPDEN